MLEVRFIVRFKACCCKLVHEESKKQLHTPLEKKREEEEM